MSFPIFKDLDKRINDLFGDDFDNKISLKVKTAGPFGTTVTNTLDYADKDGKGSLKPKVSVKWPHPSGFTLDKLDVSNDCKLNVETSLVGAIEGAKLEFKGNDTDKADVHVRYNHAAATVTGDFDINNLGKAEVGVVAGHGAIRGGVSAKIGHAKDANNVSVALGLSHEVPKVCFTSVRALDNFSTFALLASYNGVNKLDLAVGANYDGKKVTGKALAGYKFDCCTYAKAKVNTEGIVNLSLKKTVEKNFSVVAATEIPTNNPKGFKWGLNLTVG